jgi:hypothetical protein
LDDSHAAPVAVSIRCANRLVARVRYVFDSLFLSAGIGVVYVDHLPADGPSIRYGPAGEDETGGHRCVFIPHCPEAWSLFEGSEDVGRCVSVDGLPLVLPHTVPGADTIRFDLVANAFYFLSSWTERRKGHSRGPRQLYTTSPFARLGIAQDVVDRYLACLLDGLDDVDPGRRDARRASKLWPNDATFAVVLSHDVDFLPSGLTDNLRQGAKTLARHLVRHRNPSDAARAGAGLVKALSRGRDPYGCVPEIIEAERRLEVRSSFQVAVERRHPADVNYDVDDDATRDYLRAITDAGFDLCLHGSYRSTEQPDWFCGEVDKLARRLGRPLGSRQHYLSFDYDTLFAAQEASGIRYDMSMGFPDHPGSRVGFSHPYFPYDFTRERPFDVVEIGLVLMDATLRGYMNLSPRRASAVIDDTLRDLRDKRGAASVVWHPIVFGGARDPGYDELYWGLIERVRELGGWPTDGRAINDAWRARARNYTSFAAA